MPSLVATNTAAQSDKEAGVTVWKTKKHFRPPNSISGHSEWKPVTIEIHSTMQAGVVRVEGKRSLWGLEVVWPLAVKGIFAPSTPKDPVVGFITPRGNIWVGREKHFYIESSAGVVGADYENGIVWFESMVARKGQDKTTLDDCLRLFEREIDGDTLELFSSDMWVAPNGKLTLCPLVHFTGLCPPLDPEILRDDPPAPDSPPGDVHLTGFQVTGNTLRLDLRSRRDGLFLLKGAMETKESLSSTGIVVQIRAANRPSEILTMKVPFSRRTRGQYVASVWIDIPSKTVTKAEENGRFMEP
ncbi:MAG: hypothetical protein NT105_09245 [Verrucomicrobia bacterium]|nr:hypothetical protein [Verrucomicrobiota bacterium]